MASIPCVLTVLLICMSLEHMVFSSVGGSATLPCSNVVYPSCSSTTWLKSTSNQAVGLVEHGKFKTDVPQNNRLRLASNCALHLANVTTEDAGLYTCQQFLTKGGPQHGEDAPIYLSVLQVFSTSREAEMEKGSHVTLHCQLHTRDNCGASVEGVSLRWADCGGKELKNNNKHQIRTESRCHITLTEELRGPNPDHTRRCQLTVRQQIQSSATYTIRVTGVTPTSSSSSSSSKSSSTKTTTTTALATESSTPKADQGPPAPTGGGAMAGVGVCVCLLAAALITVVVIHKRRANAGGEQKHKSAQGRTTATAMQSVQPPRSSADGEQEAELHYAAFQHLNPTQAGPAAKQSNDTVTYSSIMQLSGGEDQSNSRPVDPSAVYATVQKNNNAHN